jgi:xanthine dehydrogenase small subunit
MHRTETRPIRFIRGGEPVTLEGIAPDRTLLDVLRTELGCTGTKEGCGEGDCGACAVVVAQPEGEGLRYRAINSCIRLAHSVDGVALWTVEDLAAQDGTLHPAQEAMVRCHGSQCGFCTPGFVMSLFGMYRQHVANGRTITRELAQEDLSGNLCRCTGYRPILDAAQQMAQLPSPAFDEEAVRRQLDALRTEPAKGESAGYLAPTSLPELLQARARDPGAQLVAGCTDVGLWITKMHRSFERVLDVTRCEDLLRIERDGHHLAIGAAVPLADAFAALVAERPQLKTFANRFAGLPVRNSGTLGGNVANGSPIGDSMPLLIAVRARLVLQGIRGTRELAIEDFYTGYRQNVLARDELLTCIKVPLPRPGELLRAYKISKRTDDDISAVCLAIALHLDGDIVGEISIGAGGVAATPARAGQAEAALRGQEWNAAAVERGADALRGEFQPLSDLRASAAYRRDVLGNLVRRFWLESQSAPHVNLATIDREVLA